MPGLGSCRAHLGFRDSQLERATMPTEKLSCFCSHEGWCLGKKDGQRVTQCLDSFIEQMQVKQPCKHGCIGSA